MQSIFSHTVHLSIDLVDLENACTRELHNMHLRQLSFRSIHQPEINIRPL